MDAQGQYIKFSIYWVNRLVQAQGVINNADNDMLITINSQL